MRTNAECGIRRSLSSSIADFVSSVTMVKWAVEMGYDISRAYNIVFASKVAASLGETAVLEWLRQSSGFIIPLQTYMAAARSGQIETLQ